MCLEKKIVKTVSLITVIFMHIYCLPSDIGCTFSSSLSSSLSLSLLSLLSLLSQWAAVAAQMRHAVTRVKQQHLDKGDSALTAPSSSSSSSFSSAASSLASSALSPSASSAHGDGSSSASASATIAANTSDKRTMSPAMRDRWLHFDRSLRAFERQVEHLRSSFAFQV